MKHLEVPMADIPIPVKTYILKVNLQRCVTCPKKLEKVLMNTDGVYAFKINTKQGLVKIACTLDLDLDILKQTIEKKVGIVAEIYEYEPKRDKKNGGKHQSRVDNYSHTDYDHAHHCVHGTRPMPRRAGGSASRHHPQNSIRNDGFDPRMLGNVPGPQPGIARPPYYGDVQYRSGHYGPGIYIRPPPPLPPHGYYGTMLPGPYVHNLYEPLEPPKGIAPPPPPPPPPHGYYGGRLPGPYVHSLNDPREAPKGNSMFHSISDENVGAPPCTIM